MYVIFLERYTFIQKKRRKKAEVIRRNSYVDDIIKSIECKDEARKVIEEIESMLKEGGFRIKFSSTEFCSQRWQQ